MKYGELTINGNPYRLIAYGYCHCGCGEKTALIKNNNARLGMIKGKPNNFITGHNQKLKITNKCPRCKVAEKFFFPGGRKSSYCRNCFNELSRLKSEPIERKRHFDGLCPKCRIREKIKGRPYCLICEGERRKERRIVGLNTTIGTTRVCPICKSTFIVSNGYQKYCKDDCFQSARKIKHIEYARSGRKKASLQLTDTYVKSILRSHTLLPLKTSEIPKELILIHREYIKLKRSLIKTNICHICNIRERYVLPSGRKLKQCRICNNRIQSLRRKEKNAKCP